MSDLERYEDRCPATGARVRELRDQRALQRMVRDVRATGREPIIIAVSADERSGRPDWTGWIPIIFAGTCLLIVMVAIVATLLNRPTVYETHTNPVCKVVCF